MAKKRYEMDMCNGPLAGKILMFTFPLMLSNIMQLLFNAVDMIVVGRYCGSNALAAVGSTAALINLLINFFVGLSIGANVLVARYYGAHNKKDLREMVHTAVATSIIGGVVLTIIGIVLAKPLLIMMQTPEEVLGQATLYLRVYFLGMPVLSLYNFGSAILRAAGDTKRPLYFLTIAGVINAALNIMFVVYCGLGVSGVALGTILSQAVSSALVIICLVKSEGICRLKIKEIKIHKEKFKKMIQIGAPAGIQGTVFSLSNVLIQSSINSFGSVAMAGSSASSNIENFVYMSMNSFHHTALNFTGQNVGAKKYDRVNKILILCVGLVALVGIIIGGGVCLGAEKLLGFYTSDPEVIRYGKLRLTIICSTYCLCGMMDAVVGVLRGLGYAAVPMAVSIIGACGLRIVWIMTIFAKFRTLEVLYVSYPVTWIITTIAHIICFFIIRKKVLEKRGESGVSEAV